MTAPCCFMRSPDIVHLLRCSLQPYRVIYPGRGLRMDAQG